MNTRIQELAAQAGWGPTHDPYTRQAFNVKLFAELVVEHCATVADFAHLGGVVGPGAMIREYFGVGNEKV